MRHRIEISVLPQWRDSRGESVRRQIECFLKIPVKGLRSRDVYTFSADISRAEAEKIAAEFANPVLQKGIVGETVVHDCDWLVSVGFKPGVTDNVARTAHEAAGDIIGRKLRDDEHVFSSIEYLLHDSRLGRADVEKIASGLLANNLIETVTILSGKELEKAPVPMNLPLITGAGGGEVRVINLEVSDGELMKISRKGILALSLEEMKSIQGYFRKAGDRGKHGLGKNPTDLELEVIAQTWSEHCKHKIFDAEILYEDEKGKKKKIVSCFKTFIKKSTEEISKKVDWLVSVFHDNAGVIAFNDKLDLVYKVETHNSPSALDPYGGSMTGIVGVNRDPMGTGQGADLLINVWGYCLGSPFTDEKDVPPGLLHPRRLRDGIHKGVIDGGNQSGIPYGLGWEFFEERYLGKPLVYCGTVGTLPKKIGKRKGFEKEIKPGDLIVMAGGRIGKDGIHGATFSSEELHQDSPVQAVQIGDPITQKKMSDFIMEARSKGLYRFITDNGAGGLSSSVGEMSSICGGCRMDLKKAPLKYAGLQPWEILVSEAQERMSFAVPPENIDEFKKLAAARDVEVSVLGEFTDSGKFHILWGDKTAGCIDIEFLHEGLPRMKLKAKWTPPQIEAPAIKKVDCDKALLSLLGSLNICSDESKARQYDHEVKGASVLKPFYGAGRDVAAEATVTAVAPLSKEGVVLSAAILPRYSDVDTYHMTASVIDLALRRAVAVGGKPGHLAGLDNFCWPDPVQSEKTPDGEYKLAQLVRANQALYDYTIAFKVPCVSGKDSMKNDSTKGGKKISIPPSLLFSVIGKIDDVTKCVTPDLKSAGDIVYVAGVTKAELGGSEFLALRGETAPSVPEVDFKSALKTYSAVHKIISKRLAHSIHSPSIGGLAVSLAKKCMSGRLGMDFELDAVPREKGIKGWEILFSESNSRFVLTCSPKKAKELEKLLKGVPFARAGVVTDSGRLNIISSKYPDAQASLTMDKMLKAYKTPLNSI
jgi:phosphoribosylformylglycinamidine synthase